jgi:hypothetical protein|tara:strand:- start:1471 stop:1722 length:252 start_codon:yes stop_codon:yes gene_type:complete
MALSTFSRYQQVLDQNGTAVVKRKSKTSGRSSTIVSVQGQTFQEIAAQWLGDPGQYWRIADLNPHVPFPDEIPMGTRLRIPAV